MTNRVNASSNLPIRERLGLRPIINASGTMTTLGASIMVPEAIKAMAEIGSEFVEMDDLQRAASKTIARLTGGEAGFVASSAAGGIILSVAGAMTGSRLLSIERLPLDTTGLKTEIVLQYGHNASYGNSIVQAIRIAGGTPVLAGSVNSCSSYQVEESITEKTAAGFYTVAHSTMLYGTLSLPEFVAVCHAKGVPVIVDAAAEYDLRRFLAEGADIVIYSGHKFLGGPTSGVVAGRKDLVRAGYLQNRGIGRGMKVGKESIVGLIAALEAWEVRDHKGLKAKESAIIELWCNALRDHKGIDISIAPDTTENPVDRLEVRVKPESGYTANGLVAALGAGDRPIMVRGYQVDRGRFWLDPCNLHEGEAEYVASRLVELLIGERPANAMAAPDKAADSVRSWPD